MCIWWKFSFTSTKYSRQTRDIIKLICGSHSLHNSKSNRVCQICDMFKTDSMCHMLFRCTALDASRRPLMDDLLESLPKALRAHFLGVNDVEKTALLLSAFNSSFITEWKDIFTNCLLFVTNQYSMRN